MSLAPRAAERYVAFLKGINVGGHNVKMDRLRALFSAVGIGGSNLESVESYIASGNIIFSARSGEARAIETAIASHLAAALGYAVPTFVRTLEATGRIAAAKPFPEAEPGSDGSSLYIAFLPEAPAPAAAERIEAAGSTTDRFTVDGSELYWLCSTRFSESPYFGPAFERLLGTVTTVRNATTVRKLAAKYGATAD